MAVDQPDWTKATNITAGTVTVASGTVAISSGAITIIGTTIPVQAMGDLQGGPGLPPITAVSVALAAGASAAIVPGVVNKSIQYYVLQHASEGAAGTAPEWELQDSGTPDNIAAGSYVMAGQFMVVNLFGITGGNGHAALLHNADSVAHNHRGSLVFREV